MKKPRHSQKVSEHFSKRDFVCRCAKCESSVKVSLGLVGGLEFLRSKAKGRINIIKGYECPEASEGVKVKRNFHVLGIAADITIDKKLSTEVFRLAEEIPEFKGIGLNLDKDYVHVDTRKDPVRSVWVIQNGEQIFLTEENRARYLG
jgi:uncharacterized protein YcbK (DUF882 family)